MNPDRLRLFRTILRHMCPPNSPSEASWLPWAPPGRSSRSSNGSSVVNILGLRFLNPPGLLALAGWRLPLDAA